MANYFEPRSAGATKRIVAELDRAQLRRMFTGTYRFHQGGKIVDKCTALTLFLNPAHPVPQPMMRFDFGQLDSVEVPVVLDGTDGKLLWLEGELPDRSRAFVFARPPGIIGGNPQRTCAKIWVAIYYPGSTTPRPKTYSFVSKTPVLGESVNECPPTPVPDLDIVVRGGDEVRIFQDDEAEGYHED